MDQTAFLALRELSGAWASVEAALLPHMYAHMYICNDKCVYVSCADPCAYIYMYIIAHRTSAAQASGPASSARGKRRKGGEGEDEEAAALPFAVKSTRSVVMR